MPQQESSFKESIYTPGAIRPVHLKLTAYCSPNKNKSWNLYGKKES